MFGGEDLTETGCYHKHEYCKPASRACDVSPTIKTHLLARDFLISKTMPEDIPEVNPRGRPNQRAKKTHLYVIECSQILGK